MNLPLILAIILTLIAVSGTVDIINRFKRITNIKLDQYLSELCYVLLFIIIAIVLFIYHFKNN